jgi:hypothetical protein
LQVFQAGLLVDLGVEAFEFSDKVGFGGLFSFGGRLSCLGFFQLRTQSFGFTVGAGIDAQRLQLIGFLVTRGLRNIAGDLQETMA